MAELHSANTELRATAHKFGLELRPLMASREGLVKDRNLAQPRMQVSSGVAVGDKPKAKWHGAERKARFVAGKAL